MSHEHVRLSLFGTDGINDGIMPDVVIFNILRS